jgi:hypothetical protein
MKATTDSINEKIFHYESELKSVKSTLSNEQFENTFLREK